MADYIFQANIDHYKHLLAVETDPQKITMLRKLLAEEEAKLADFRAKNPKPKSAE
jgi:predicted phosphatase